MPARRKNYDHIIALYNDGHDARGIAKILEEPPKRISELLLRLSRDGRIKRRELPLTKRDMVAALWSEGKTIQQIADEMKEKYEHVGSMVYKLKLSGKITESRYVDRKTGVVRSETIQSIFIREWNAGKTRDEICLLTGQNRATFRNMLAQLRARGSLAPRNHLAEEEKIQDKFMKAWKDGKTQNEIIKITGQSRLAARSMLRKLRRIGLIPRPVKQAKKEKEKRARSPRPKRDGAVTTSQPRVKKSWTKIPAPNSIRLAWDNPAPTLTPKTPPPMWVRSVNETKLSSHRKCTYPMWTDGTRPHWEKQNFCEELSIEGKSWCPHHYTIVFRPPER